MSNVLIINTGGTIGMVKTPIGYQPDGAAFRAALEDMKELRDPKMPGWNMISMEPLLDSSDVAVEHWNRMGELIAENYDRYDGFVVLHGTDTMAYTASAMSFMLEGINKPVIFTGSQIPLCELRSDGRDNLITSLMIAGSGMVHEVCIYFGEKLLRGNRAVKYSSEELVAFVSPNYPLLAEADISIKYNSKMLHSGDDSRVLHFQPLENIPIGVIKVFPGIQFSLFEGIMTEKLKGVVLEAFGAGNIPSQGKDLLSIVRKARDNGTVLTVCSQCTSGSVLLGAYAASDPLISAGAVSGCDMTTEAAIAKLYYLFSKGLDKDHVRDAMSRNICGELTEQSVEIL